MPTKPMILDEIELKLSPLKHLDKKAGLKKDIEARLNAALKSRLTLRLP